MYPDPISHLIKDNQHLILVVLSKFKILLIRAPITNQENTKIDPYPKYTVHLKEKTSFLLLILNNSQLKTYLLILQINYSS